MTHTLISARVVSRRREASDVASFRLVSTEEAVPLPRFDAGAHIDVHLGDGITRKYSLCNAPGERGVYEIAVKLEPYSRGGSSRLGPIAVGFVASTYSFQIAISMLAGIYVIDILATLFLIPELKGVELQ